MELLTFGHGTRSQEELGGLIGHAGLMRVVDVRTVPKSRRHPWVWHDKMSVWVPAQTGAQYVWQPDLGGFRKPDPASTNTALRNAAFRGYADYMQTKPFLNALTRLVESLPDGKTAVMCSETLWWRCHRRLIADAAVLLHHVDVRHLMTDGSLHAHVLTKGVRLAGDSLCYDGGQVV